MIFVVTTSPVYNFQFSLPFAQIADQVGELLIHCRYGTKPIEDDADEYEVDPDGEWVT